ncbi:coproporphyrinogen III oxidase [Serratia symbiotica str. 'Cinara cedri']|nr:coproporphyrinogen III oxidase [Serratia symbiotica str. 'Cinara cedri']
MLKLPPLGLYIHIPWCTEKCPYCDFNSYALKDVLPYKQYIDHLLLDLDADLPLIGDREISTIFIGGGTPTLFSPQNIQLLLEGVRSRTLVANNAEVTIEANPSTVEANYFSGYQSAGVNRISIGIQSFNAEQLILLGRIHSVQEAKYASYLASDLGLRSFNLDLIHGLPAQSLGGAMNDLYQAITLNTPHLSWYQLTIEPNTLYSSRSPILPKNNILWDIFEQGHQLLSIAGYQQYEISSYAKSVYYQCQHNLNYWRFGDYLGIGCGAHSKLTFSSGRILRLVKTKHPRGFMQGKYRDQQYEVALVDRPLEFFMNRFRLLEPAPRIDFFHYTGLEESVIRSQLDKALMQGYIKETAEYWQITEQGKFFLNTLLEWFLVD